MLNLLAAAWRLDRRLVGEFTVGDILLAGRQVVFEEGVLVLDPQVAHLDGVHLFQEPRPGQRHLDSQNLWFLVAFRRYVVIVSVQNRHRTLYSCFGVLQRGLLDRCLVGLDWIRAKTRNQSSRAHSARTCSIWAESRHSIGTHPTCACSPWAKPLA